MRAVSNVSVSDANVMQLLEETARTLQAEVDAEHREIRRTISALIEDDEDEGAGRDVGGAEGE